MKIWVDADACPVAIKEIIFRAAQRTKVDCILVANQTIRTPPAKNIRMRQVAQGFDNADKEIERCAAAGDLIITADIPLAADVIAKGAIALSPRGELHTHDNIKARLNIRDFMDTMRASGIDTGGPPPLSAADRKQFADHLDRILAKRPV